jgi:hypothetical protein
MIPAQPLVAAKTVSATVRARPLLALNALPGQSDRFILLCRDVTASWALRPFLNRDYGVIAIDHHLFLDLTYRLVASGNHRLHDGRVRELHSIAGFKIEADIDAFLFEVDIGPDIIEHGLNFVG